jgi:MOSC domain-containing protein YiiM
MTGKKFQVLGVQLGHARKVKIGERHILTAIGKTRVNQAVAVQSLGLQGDKQVDLSVHGGLEKAVYAYPSEHYSYWLHARQEAGLAEIDNRLDFGSMGENLTFAGLLETDVWVGDVLRLPHCVLRVTQPREPCFKFNAAMGFNAAVKQMAQTGFCGFYLSVDEPGMVSAGEVGELFAGPRQVSITDRIRSKMFKHLR